MFIYSIKDRLADEFAPPFMSHNDETARRATRQMFAKMPGTAMSDFEIWRLAKFDQKTGLLSNIVPTLIPWIGEEVPITEVEEEPMLPGGKK